MGGGKQGENGRGGEKGRWGGLVYGRKCGRREAGGKEGKEKRERSVVGMAGGREG